MRLFTRLLLCLLIVIHCSYAPPVTPEKAKEDGEVQDDLEEYMEYHRYLKEVVQALESDPEFRQRLEKADEEDVRSGKIAEQLDFVNHNIRTKLDEIKRRELDRLRHLATKQYELTNNLDTDMGKVSTNEHLDHANPHTFEIEDLKKLIKKTTSDLEAADKRRKAEFKEYEMQKEFEKHQQLEGMDETQKKEYMEKMKQEEEAKKHHAPLHHPVTREQLLDIWKSSDKMDTKDFNTKVFFMLHDVDGNGVWDADEVKALFIKELDKLYGPGGPNKDLHERAEEMERMREHVFKENDKNQDGLIDFNEFMMETQKADFNQDEGWKPIEENQVYTQDEYHEFERRRLEELRYLQQQGLVDAHGRPIPGAQHQINQARHQFQAYQQQQAFLQQQQAYNQQFQQYPPGQGQQAYQQPPYQGQYQQGQQPGQFQQQPPQYQQPPPGQQSPQGQYQQQSPQGQLPSQQLPQGQFHQQVPQGQQQLTQGQQLPPQGQQLPPQGQQSPPQGQQLPQQGQQLPPQGQQLPPQGQQLPPQGQPQAQQPSFQQQSQGQSVPRSSETNLNMGQVQPNQQASPQQPIASIPREQVHSV